MQSSDEDEGQNSVPSLSEIVAENMYKHQTSGADSELSHQLDRALLPGGSCMGSDVLEFFVNDDAFNCPASELPSREHSRTLITYKVPCVRFVRRCVRALCVCDKY